MKSFLLNCLPVLVSLLIIFLMGVFIAHSTLEVPVKEWVIPRIVGTGLLAQCIGIPLGVLMLIGTIRDSQYLESPPPINLYAGLAFAMVLLISNLVYLIMLFVFNLPTDSRLHAAHLMISISVVVGIWLVWMMFMGGVGMIISKGLRSIR